MIEGFATSVLRDLYIDYDSELCQLPGMIYDKQRISSWATGMVLRNDIKWNVIANEGEAIGFLITDSNEEVADVYVVDTYILPEYRRQGLMSAHVLKTFEEYKGKTIGLSVIQSNYSGMKFWRSIFKALKVIPELNIEGGFVNFVFKME